MGKNKIERGTNNNKVQLFEKHEKMFRNNSESNPVILPCATWLLQPNGLPFNAQCSLNLNQAKVLVKIIEKLQKPIKETISNERLKKYPEQLELFQNDSEEIKLQFDLSEFGVIPANYSKLITDIVAMKNYTVQQDVVLKSELTGKEIEATKYQNILSSVTIPKKYEREISLSMGKDVAKKFAAVDDMGFTKYILEIAMESNSKYTLLIYQLISQWKDKGGFSWSVDNFKKKIGISEKYNRIIDLNNRVIKPAYLELHEKADIWFEYDFEKKKEKTFINFKIIIGHYEVQKKNVFVVPDDITYILEYPELSENQKKCHHILINYLLFNNKNIILEIVDKHYEEFLKWYNINETRLDKMNNPAGLLMSYLRMTKKDGWSLKKYDLIKDNVIINKTNDNKIDKEIKKIWVHILEEIKKQISEKEFTTWIKPINILNINENELVIYVPSLFFKQELEGENESDGYVDIIYRSAAKVTGFKGSIIYRLPQ